MNICLPSKLQWWGWNIVCGDGGHRWQCTCKWYKTSTLLTTFCFFKIMIDWLMLKVLWQQRGDRFTDSLPKCLLQLGLDQVEVRSQELHLGLCYRGGKYPSIWTITCCLPALAGSWIWWRGEIWTGVPIWEAVIQVAASLIVTQLLSLLLSPVSLTRWIGNSEGVSIGFSLNISTIAILSVTVFDYAWLFSFISFRIFTHSKWLSQQAYTIKTPSWNCFSEVPLRCFRG